MLYVWKCNECGEHMTVQRKVADYKQGPHDLEAIHPDCHCREFTRVITPPMAVKVHENESQYWDDDNYH